MNQFLFRYYGEESNYDVIEEIRGKAKQIMKIKSQLRSLYFFFCRFFTALIEKNIHCINKMRTKE